MWNVPDREWKIISSIQELSTGKNTRDWIPLNLFLLCANEQKHGEKTSLKFYHCQTLTLDNKISEGEQVVCPHGNVLERSQYNSGQMVSLKYFLSNYALLNTTDGNRLKWCYGFNIQCSLQELRLCLFSINHFMVTGGGLLVSPSSPPPLLTSGATASFKHQPKQKSGAACSHNWSSRGHTGGPKQALSSYCLYIISILEHRHQTYKERERGNMYVWERESHKWPQWPLICVQLMCGRVWDNPAELGSGDLQVAQGVTEG